MAGLNARPTGQPLATRLPTLIDRVLVLEGLKGSQLPPHPSRRHMSDHTQAEFIIPKTSAPQLPTCLENQRELASFNRLRVSAGDPPAFGLPGAGRGSPTNPLPHSAHAPPPPLPAQRH